MATSRIFAFDTCTVAHLLAAGPWAPQIEPIYQMAVKGKVLIVVSEITIAECCKLKYADGTEIPIVDAKTTIGGFFQRKFVDRRQVTDRESWLAAEYKRLHSFKTCDAIIAATAAIAGAESLITTDGCGSATKGKLLSVPEIKRPDGGTMTILSPDKVK